MNRDDLFRGFEPPPPPPGLREAALRAGRAAMAASPPRDRWTALFTSRSLRVAWLTAVLVLTFAHARVPREGRAVVTAAGAELELTEVAQLFRLAENSPRAAAGFALEGGPL